MDAKPSLMPGHSMSAWSSHIRPIEPESIKAWSTFFAPNQVFTVQSSPSGRIFTVDRRWSVYSISLVDFTTSPVPTSSTSPKPTSDPSRCSAALLDENDKFLLLLSGDYRKLHRFNLDHGEWSTTNLDGPHPLERDWAALTIISSNLYLFGGQVAFEPTRTQHVNELWRLNMNSGQPAKWDLVKPSGSAVPRPRASHRLVSNGQNLFLYGGWDGAHIADSWEYDPGMNTWKEHSPIGCGPAAVSRHALLVNNAIFALGDGSSAFSVLAALKISDAPDPSRDWYDLQHLSLARHEHFAASALSGNHLRFIASNASRIFVFEIEQRGTFDDTVTIYTLDTAMVMDPTSNQPISRLSATPNQEGVNPNQQPEAQKTKPDSLALVKLCIAEKEYHSIDIPQDSIAGGAFGDIFVGTHKPTGTKLALKRVRITSPSKAENYLRRAERETKMWSDFEHENVLPFLGTMAIEPHLYLVSPWLENGDLAEFSSACVCYLNEEEKGTAKQDPRRDAYRAFSEKQAIQEIAAGIAYLHSLAFVHGDLKGKNIILGDDYRPLLCDFGLSKVEGTNTSHSLKSVGTWRWQSPELFEDRPKTLKSDVYAFGMIITEVLTGSHPLPALATNLIFMNHVVNKGVRPSFEPPSRSGVDFIPLWNIAARCWAAEPSDRPSIDVVFSQLQAIPTARKV